LAVQLKNAHTDRITQYILPVPEKPCVAPDLVLPCAAKLRVVPPETFWASDEVLLVARKVLPAPNECLFGIHELLIAVGKV